MIAVVFNPTARGDRARGLREVLGRVAHGATLLPTSRAGEATVLARQAAEAGADVVVAAGGDGTVNEVLNGLCQIPFGRRPALAVLALGTVNVFAREMEMPASLEAAWPVILGGRTRTIDVAVASHGGGVRRFVQLAGAGLDAEAIRRVNRGLKRMTGPLAYVWAGLGAWASSLPQVEVAGPGFQARGELVLVGNGGLYGGKFRVFPGAALDDGILDVAVLPRASFIGLARAATAAWHGRLGSLPGVQHLAGSDFAMDSARRGTRFQVEGDDAGELPVRFSMEAGMLRVVTGSRIQRRD